MAPSLTLISSLGPACDDEEVPFRARQGSLAGNALRKRACKVERSVCSAVVLAEGSLLRLGLLARWACAVIMYSACWSGQSRQEGQTWPVSVRSIRVLAGLWSGRLCECVQSPAGLG
jgi:hypothetical protein